MNQKIRSFGIGLSLASGAFFGGPAARANDNNFEQGKTMTLKMLDERIEDLKRTRSCVIRAESREALKECRAEVRENRREMHKEVRDAREAVKRQKEAKRE